MFCFIRLDELVDGSWRFGESALRNECACLCDFFATLPYIQGRLRFNPSPPSLSDGMGVNHSPYSSR